MRAFLSLTALLVLSCGPSPAPKWAVPVSPEGLSGQCRSGDAEVCARLMQQANTDEEFGHYGQLACEHGETRACEYLGNMFFVRSRSPRDSEDATRLAAQSKRMYELGCRHDAWYSCVLVAEMASADLELRKKAHALTEAACLDEGSHEACEMLTISLQDAGQFEEAKDMSTRGCRAFLSNASQADWLELRKDTRVCEMAMEFGVPAHTLLPIIDGRGLRRVPSESLDAKRTRGTAQIHPPRSVSLQMSTKGPRRAEAEFRLCLSSLGRVSDINLTISSGFPAYDRKLFEAMQKWQYRPLLTDGKPTPCCTSVTFVYFQL